MKKILVTGTAGFIGFHTVRKLLAKGYTVIGLDNINDYYDVNLKYGRLLETGIAKDKIAEGKIVKSDTLANYAFIKLDLTNATGIRELFLEHKFDGVINLAAQAGVRYSLVNPHAYTESNVTGFLNILEGCRSVNVGHLVYASTSSVYGLNANMPLNPHESAEHPITLYAATKKANEMMAHSYSHLFQFPTTGVRFFTVYGSWGRPDMALFLFTKAILENRLVKVFNNGEMIRDFTYVEDIADGLCHILERPASSDNAWSAASPDPARSSAPYRVVNLGNSQPIKLLDYIQAIEEALQKKAILEMLPMQPGDVPATNADMTDTIKDYGYKPSVMVKEGIKKFVEWYLAFYKA
jgi:UDP-glucuronate 4-epimerase